VLAIDLGGDRRPFRQDNALYLPVRRCGVKALTWILHAFEGVAACEIAKVPVLQGQ